MASTANGPASPIRLYDLAPEPGVCPFVQRAKIVLKEKNLPYTTTYIDKANKDPDFLKKFRSITANPNHRGTVPVIVDGDVELGESDVVSEYLDVKYPNSGAKIFPTDPYKLALVRLFVGNFTSLAGSAKILASENLQQNEEAVGAYIDGLKVVDAFLSKYGDKGGDFLLGKDISYAEAATLPFLYRSNLLLAEYRDLSVDKVIEDNKLSHLKAWKEAGFKRPSVKETLPPDSVIKEGGRARVTVALKDLK